MTLQILFIHQNFPGQFLHLAPVLAAAGHQVTALCLQPLDRRSSAQQEAPTAETNWQGVRVLTYQVARNSSREVHPWIADLEAKTIRAQACLNACLALQRQGYTPDVVIAHPGWGEPLFIREVWPAVRLGLYAEFYYHARGADTGFDPEFPAADPVADACRLRLKNLNNDLQYPQADAVISPTHWQASTFPEAIRRKISVIHDGIDTRLVAPDPGVRLRLQTARGPLQLTRADEVITFVNRNLEPYRGYHTFMRALPMLLAQRPQARVLIVGGEEVSYGARPADGRSWKEIFIREVRPQISDADWARVHFLGQIAYQHFIPLLQLSRVHVYLTYPFVLSWSLLEAMSAGCAIVASDTQPLHEAIRHDETGRLVSFFDPHALAGEICTLLDDPEARQRLGHHARTFAQTHYDLQRVCLPHQLAWVMQLASG
ncbi:glycosyltransferase [Pseudomonas sp. NW5]|uniref:glycosyltransferase n=1 Tax=Pseudomonas sp. NW5 TaxID=2934934 RepID=UPI002020BF0F|nr:glycosyltransferase [Pseudomonas sp. NW5]MCL7461866.1 glycosyltransferase [Pseudomonas sp. NW5]